MSPTSVPVLDTVSRNELEELARAYEGPCVSVYQRTHHDLTGIRRPARQSRVRLKNLLRDGEVRLAALGVGRREAQRLLQPARELLHDATARVQHGKGLAVFTSPEMARAFRLAAPVDPLLVVGQRFHLTPLAGAMTPNRHFYVLALSQNAIRLWRGTRDDIVEIALPGVPRTLREALQDGRQRQLQFHTGTPRRQNRRAAVFHGHADDGKGDIARFFRQVNHGVTGAIRRAPAPLLLAAVEYLAPIYAAANTYPQLLDERIRGNPQGVTPVELHARAWPLVESRFVRKRDTAAARYLGLRGTGKAANDVASVVAAAKDGRVEVLFVALGIVPLPHCEDLLNVAVIHTVTNRGTVYAVPPSQMPDAAPIAALFRY